MKVGLYSPMPPASTGVADYSAALLTELQKHGRVEVAPASCDVALYHIGNNPLHKAHYARAIRNSGVVVLHDALLQHFYLGSLRRGEYIEEFVYNYGEFAREEAELLWRNRALSAQDARYFVRPMLRRICESARAVIVHNPAAARAVLAHSPRTQVHQVSHLVEGTAMLPTGAVERFRASLGVPAKGFVFAVFGYLRETKRLIAILRAFVRLHRLRPDTCLLVAGQFVSKDLERSTGGWMAEPGVIRRAHLSLADLKLAAAAVDCCLNLRYPTAGETSGIAMRLMSAGKPLVVTEGEEWANMPELALLRIPSGPGEEEALFSAMAVLEQRPELAREMGRQAANHIQRYHSVSGSGEQYWKILCGTFASSF